MEAAWGNLGDRGAVLETGLETEKRLIAGGPLTRKTVPTGRSASVCPCGGRVEGPLEERAKIAAFAARRHNRSGPLGLSIFEKYSDWQKATSARNPPIGSQHACSQTDRYD